MKKALDEFLSKFPEETIDIMRDGVKIQEELEFETDPERRAILEKLLDEAMDKARLSVLEEMPHGELN